MTQPLSEGKPKTHETTFGFGSLGIDRQLLSQSSLSAGRLTNPSFPIAQGAFEDPALVTGPRGAQLVKFREVGVRSRRGSANGSPQKPARSRRPRSSEAFDRFARGRERGARCVPKASR